MVRSPTSTDSAADHERTGGHVLITRGGELKLDVAARARALFLIVQSYLPGHQSRHPPGSTWPPQS